MLVSTGCEGEDCPAPDDQVAVSFFSYGGSLPPYFVVTEVSPSEVRIGCPSCMDGSPLIAAGTITPAPPLTAFTPGQAIQVVSHAEGEFGDYTVRLTADDALTGQPLLRYYYAPFAVDMTELGLAPFEFSGVSHCGPRGSHRQAFDVTLGDESVRVHDRSTAKLGDYTIWVGASLDETAHVADSVLEHDISHVLMVAGPYTSMAILYTP